MKKILLVQTGGTISCKEDSGELHASPKVTDLIWERYREQHQGEVYFTVIKPYTILSENLKPDRWAELTNAINLAEPEKYDGVIVTHGTDSIDFTREFLKIHYGSGISVIGALYPPTDPRTDAFTNFEKAVHLCGPVKAKVFDYPLHRGLVITAYPGLDYSLYRLEDEKPDFIIHIMYHSGTGCASREQNYDLKHFVKKAHCLGISVYAIGFPEDSNVYAGHKILEATGLKFLPGLPFSEVLVKLTLGLKLP